MPPPFKQLTPAEFVVMVERFPWRPAKTEIHMHHTWRPRRSDYAGLRTIEAMYRYHTQENGWSDIAQHVSISPDGTLWTGRHWNQTPASALGFNHRGVFMFEMIGDFDRGREPWDGAQKATTLLVIATIARHFAIDIARALRFHNQFTADKTCPGDSLEREAVIALAQARLETLGVESPELFSQFERKGFLARWRFNSDLERFIANEVEPGEREIEEGEHRHSPEYEAGIMRYL